ncbi:MAG: hypothetical protein KAR32_13020 [Candidatus Omnitrophica bacterium]|nr:hypothetical protein [Candidatus Omnitrophota bacterium]
MNKRQKDVLVNSIIVTTVTIITVIAIMNFKDWVNRSEATRAMGHIGRIVVEYRRQKGIVPPESHIAKIKQTLEGYARLGELKYRARWIDFESTPDEILAYTRKNYNSFFFSNGYIVLRLDGRVEWMDVDDFEELLATQQSPMEANIQ